jgi:hypothetical protein
VNVTITLSDDEFDADQRLVVREALGLRSETQLAEAMKKLGKAATLEYISMFVEKGMPTRADEVRQDRLYFLLENYYENRLPPEAEVSAIFQITSSQSRTLLRNTRSRYRNKIAVQVKSTAKAVITAATKNADTDRWEMLIDSAVILEELNQAIRTKKPTLKLVQLKLGSAGQYEADPDTYTFLKGEYGVA